MIETIQIKNKLAGNPLAVPLFGKKIQTSQGAYENFCDPKILRALVALMDMEAVRGGAAAHYGGPAALAELVSVVHGLVFQEAQRVERPWYELFHIVNDAGHCENVFYALKALYGIAGLSIENLKKFRSVQSPLTGHGEVHCFPEGVFLSNGPLGSALPQAQGLALGDQWGSKERVTITFVSDGALMEGEAKESLAAIPGLASKGLLAPFILVLSDNNTKLSGRIDKDTYSMQPSFESLSILGWDVFVLEKGNDLVSCLKVMEKALDAVRLNRNKPVVVWAKTLKGIGTKKTLLSSTGGHGFPLKATPEIGDFVKEIFEETPIPEEILSWMKELEALEEEVSVENGEKIQKGVSLALLRACREGLPLVSVSADLQGSTGVADFRKEFPQNSIDVGIAESNMISTAVGLSKTGFIPVVDTFAQFGATKGALPLLMASLSEGPVVGIFSHTGFQDAADGASHQALNYLAMTSGIPLVRTVCLSSSEEAEALVYQALKEFYDKRKKGEIPLSTLFFLGRENFPKSYAPGLTYRLEEPLVVRSVASTVARKVTLLTSGSLVSQTLLAAERLEKEGIGVQCIHLSTVQPLNGMALKSLVTRTEGKLVTVEDHQVIGGVGQQVVHALVELGMQLRVKSLGVRGGFGRSAYSAQELYRKHSLDAESIFLAAKSLFHDR